MVFSNRKETAAPLAKKLGKYAKNGVIFALTRGGVPIGFELGKILKIPFEVVIVGKIGAPFNPELSIGAVAENDVRILHKGLMEEHGIGKEDLEEVIKRKEEEIAQRKFLFRGGATIGNLEGKNAILVDDGLATGTTAIAAVKAVKKVHPAKVVFASPVCSAEGREVISDKVDEFVCLVESEDFSSVGQFYKDFSQVSNNEVLRLIRQSGSLNSKNG